jgi:hypothetical protein
MPLKNNYSNIRDDIIMEVESFGFHRENIVSSIQNGECNNASAAYFILLLS